MRIGIGNDHRGVDKKNQIKEILTKMGYEVIDYGTNSEELTDFPIYAQKVGRAAVAGDIDLGILLCGTGIGMSIACNKVKGAYCAKINNKEDAYYAKNHNNVNVLSFSNQLPIYKFKKYIKEFINTDFSKVERYKKRIELIEEIENGN